MSNDAKQVGNSKTRLRRKDMWMEPRVGLNPTPKTDQHGDDGDGYNRTGNRTPAAAPLVRAKIELFKIATSAHQNTHGSPVQQSRSPMNVSKSASATVPCSMSLARLPPGILLKRSHRPSKFAGPLVQWCAFIVFVGMMMMGGT